MWFFFFLPFGLFVSLAETRQSLWLSTANSGFDIPTAVTPRLCLTVLVNFQNGTIWQLKSSLAVLSAVVKGCLIDQDVPGLSAQSVAVSIRPSWLEQCWATGPAAKPFPAVVVLCQCYCLRACVSFVMILFCVFGNVYISCALVCQSCLLRLFSKRLIRFQVLSNSECKGIMYRIWQNLTCRIFCFISALIAFLATWGKHNKLEIVFTYFHLSYYGKCVC